ncbi:hypothetical protein H310_13770 [Aphanomyces invadans]|uniref:Uncharacterized protein n=1 Tax=Aphanomyces invadans TaxID=157072 RepID=A0A024TDM6_9STRA|nr:hypothetical protein H310_13770 [Aphanomyces invadans]ETV91701.1 hypothetical protein H310_13770 [Aphanomyces invadans]|eukprot:XP_008879627.1 hypothetical protein H310_13770 [Aphanomyces invadans]
MKQQAEDLVLRKKRKLPKPEDGDGSGADDNHDDEGENSESPSAAQPLDDHDKKTIDKIDEVSSGDKKEFPKKDATGASAPVIPMTAMMFPMTMMMPMMMPFPQGGGVGLVDEVPKKKKRGRPSKKALAQQSTQSINSADQPLSMPMWPFGMPLMPLGFKFPVNPIMVAPQVKNSKELDGATTSVVKAGSVEDHSSAGASSKEVLVDDLKKKSRSTSGKPRGRPRTRPRPGDVISRPKLMNLAPAVMYDHINGNGALEKDPKDSEDDEDDDPNKGGGGLLPGERVV